MNTQRLRTFFIGCGALLLAVPIVVMMRCPTYPGADGAREASETIRAHTGGGSGGSGDSAQGPEQTAARGVVVPPGWTLADPFTDQTPYWIEYAFVSPFRDPGGSRRLLLRSPAETESQVFLVVGDAEALVALLQAPLAERRQHPLRARWEPSTVTTADGVEVNLTIHGLSAGVMGGDEITQVSGFARVGDRALLVDAGGPTGTFDPEVVVRILSGLDLDRLMAS